jgi:single-stranded DNA-specific DHH superfamily exonuclease
MGTSRDRWKKFDAMHPDVQAHRSREDARRLEATRKVSSQSTVAELQRRAAQSHADPRSQKIIEDELRRRGVNPASRSAGAVAKPDVGTAAASIAKAQGKSKAQQEAEAKLARARQAAGLPQESFSGVGRHARRSG